MDTTYVIIGIILGSLQILGFVFGFFKFFSAMKTHLAVVEHRIGEIEAQYRPNGGSSMRDALNRIEAKFSKLEGRFEQHVEENE